MGANRFDMSAMMREMGTMDTPTGAVGSRSGPAMEDAPFDLEAMRRQAGATVRNPAMGGSTLSALEIMQAEALKRAAEAEAAMRAMLAMQYSNPGGQQQWRFG